MDSIREDVLDYYQDKGARILRDPDQYSTDLSKALKEVLGRIPHPRNPLDQHPMENTRTQVSPPILPNVVVFGGLGGRADQAFSLLHQLYVTSTAPSASLQSVYLLTPESVIFLLEKGLNMINTPVGPGQLTENVGIIPVARPSVITTRGLEWDVKDWHTEFGTQISTSNHIKKAHVEVETTERVLFTVELWKR